MLAQPVLRDQNSCSASLFQYSCDSFPQVAHVFTLCKPGMSTVRSDDMRAPLALSKPGIQAYRDFKQHHDALISCYSGQRPPAKLCAARHRTQATRMITNAFEREHDLFHTANCTSSNVFFVFLTVSS